MLKIVQPPKQMPLALPAVSKVEAICQFWRVKLGTAAPKGNRGQRRPDQV